MNSRVPKGGRVTIPKALRDRLGIHPGEVLEFEADHGRLVVTKRSERDPVDAVYGILGRGEPSDILIEELRDGPDAA